MLNKIKRKFSSSKRGALSRSSSHSRATSLSSPLAFASEIECARHHEQTGNWTGAASAWLKHLAEHSPDEPSHISNTVEATYALAKAFESAGGHNPACKPPIRGLLDQIVSAISRGQAFTAERSSLFKGLDLLLMASKPSLATGFLLLSDANLEEDTELRSKFITEFVRLPIEIEWPWKDNITRQRISVFNNVIVDYCIRNSDKDHIALFFGIKRYAAECLANGQTPSPGEIRRITTIEHSQRKDIEPLTIPENGPRLATFLDHSLADVASSLAFFHPSILFDISATATSDSEFERKVLSLARLMPRYCVITKLGYPMGGGESFMHQSCAILREFGFENIWVSFTDKHGTPHSHASVTNTPYYRDVRMSGGLCAESVSAAMADHAADIVHTQGISNEIVAKCAKDARIPCLAGFHFWNGLVQLGFTMNRRILANASLHQPEDVVSADRDTLKYVASEFMADVYGAVGGTESLEVFHPVPDPSHYGVTDDERKGARFVTQINLAGGKGGEIFFSCITDLGRQGIPFLGVHSEEVEEDLLVKISVAIKHASESRLETYGPAQSIYTRSKLVIVPTLADETFCRVAFEAAANGIPVLSTRAGFIPYMLGDTGYYLPDDDAAAWIEAIRTLYGDDEKIADIGRRQREHVLAKFGKYPAAFLDATLSIASSRIHRKNIGFFTSWSDQGLGYQVRHYSHLLREAGFRTHIFSFLPYKVIGTGLKNQRNEADWSVPEHADSVYYSYNDRESVPSSELAQFVRANRVGTLVYPEICWDVNWRTMEQLSVPGLFVVGVPNLEIVRKSEALKHGSVLARTLCPTRAVEQILYSHGVRNTRYIGHGFGRPLNDGDIVKKIGEIQRRDFIRYLHIGGHNPKSRKQTPHVIEAFLLALEQRSDIRLTVTVMDTQNIEFPRHENIDYVIGSLGHDEIMALYRSNDVSIQVSSHEGVGMGFYESLANGTPVISLDVPPHNEVVLHRQTGWLLKADLVPLPDNDDPISRAARFDPQDLANLIASLQSEDIASQTRFAAAAHRERFDDVSLKLRLIEALP